MDEVDHGEFLFALLGELAGRELTLKTGRHSVWSPRSLGRDAPVVIPGELDLCAHLPLNFTGARAALLLSTVDAERLETQSHRRGTLTTSLDPVPSGDFPLLGQLLEGVLARSCALLGFLCDQPLRLCGVNVQRLSTPARRAMHEIAFTRQGMVQAELPLLLHGLDPMPTAMLLPSDLYTQAAATLSDPGRIQVAESVFLERAPALRHGLTAWLGDHGGQEGADGAGDREEEDGEGLLSSAADALRGSETEPAVGPADDETGIDALLDALAGEPADGPSTEDDEDVVLQAPEDLVFAQMFFPRNVAQVMRERVGVTVHVRAVEMAAVPLSRLCLEPPGELLRVRFGGPCKADTCLVFPDSRFAALGERVGLSTHLLLVRLMEPGFSLINGLSGGLAPFVHRGVRANFSRYRAPQGGHTIRITYEMTVSGEEPLAFVQYAPTAFVNELLGDLAGDGVDFLKGSRRNLMLGFLSLNALLGAYAIEDPARAAAWLWPPARRPASWESFCGGGRFGRRPRSGRARASSRARCTAN